MELNNRKSVLQLTAKKVHHKLSWTMFICSSIQTGIKKKWFAVEDTVASIVLNSRKPKKFQYHSVLDKIHSFLSSLKVELLHTQVWVLQYLSGQACRISCDCSFLASGYLILICVVLRVWKKLDLELTITH